jgi:hypothetical protein
MRIFLAGKLGNITKNKTNGLTEIEIALKGSVEDAGINSKESYMRGTLCVKHMIADKLKIGEELVVEINSKESE